MDKNNLQTIVLGGGCFWCTESVFQLVKGVLSVKSGYSGGHVENPTYKDVCSGFTGHVEVIKIEFDSEIIPLETLFNIFFSTHNPTTLNRQGHDIGTQYKSVIFYLDEEQKETAERIIKDIDEKGIFENKIVTEVSPLINFYESEEYHDNYFVNNGSQPYCEAVISPKVAKFKSGFSQYLKSN